MGGLQKGGSRISPRLKEVGVSCGYYDEKKSEIDIMLDRGYVRVFRSGSKRYIFII